MLKVPVLDFIQSIRLFTYSQEYWVCTVCTTITRFHIARIPHIIKLEAIYTVQARHLYTLLPSQNFLR